MKAKGRKKPARRGIVFAAGRKSKSRMNRQFDEVLRLIEESRSRAFVAVNVTLIDLYWRLGEYISLRIETGGWG